LAAALRACRFLGPKTLVSPILSSASDIQALT
jgi:hypothetical protein